MGVDVAACDADALVVPSRPSTGFRKPASSVAIASREGFAADSARVAAPLLLGRRKRNCVTLPRMALKPIATSHQARLNPYVALSRSCRPRVPLWFALPCELPGISIADRYVGGDDPFSRSVGASTVRPAAATIRAVKPGKPRFKVQYGTGRAYTKLRYM